MKVDVKKIDTLKREVKFEIPRERVSKTMDEVYEEGVRNPSRRRD